MTAKNIGMVFATRAKAETVLSKMREIINDYGYASVKDLYSISDLEEYSDAYDSFGWASLNDVTIKFYTSGFYVIDFPEPQEIQ